MKKLLKKVIVMVTAVMMLVGLLPAAVMAESEEPSITPEPTVTVSPSLVNWNETASLTIKKTDSDLENLQNLSGAKFEVYFIAELSQSNSTQLIYKTKNENVITNDELKTLSDLQPASLQSKVSTLVTKAKNYLTPVQVETNDDGIAKINNIGFGLYLVNETNPPAGHALGDPFIVAVPRTVTTTTQTTTESHWEYNVVVTPKNASKSVTKEIELANGEKVAADTVSVGDVIKYVVKGNLPYFNATELSEDGTASVNIADTMTQGLVLSEGDDYSFEIKAFNPNSEETDKYEVVGNYTLPVGGADSFTVTLKNKEDLKKYNGQKIVVTYNATVTSAITASETVYNDASIDGNKINEKPELYTFAIGVVKTGSDTNAPLQGVEFTLYSDENLTHQVGTVQTTNGAGYLKFDQLDVDYNNGEGTVYWLKETKTVSGYTLLAKPVKVQLIPGGTTKEDTEGNVIAFTPDGTISAYYVNGDLVADEEGKAVVVENRIADVAITNSKGFSLPSTGGMGTYIFTVGGIVIMAAAALVLVAMKKRNRA